MDDADKAPPADVVRAPRGRLRDAVKTIAVFALLGPVVGYVSVAVPFALSEGSRSSVHQSLLTAVVNLPFGAVFAFVFGGVPAFVTGLLVAALSFRPMPATMRIALAAALGFVVVLVLQRWAAEAVAGGGAVVLPLAGALSAAACAWISRRWVPQLDAGSE